MLIFNFVSVVQSKNRITEKSLQKNYDKWTIVKPENGCFRLIHISNTLIIVIYLVFTVNMRKWSALNEPNILIHLHQYLNDKIK